MHKKLKVSKTYLSFLYPYYPIPHLLESHWPTHIYLDEDELPFKLLSKNYPSYYPSMLEQKVLFSSKEGHIIVIEWEDFSIEVEQNCSYDRVIITEKVCFRINDSYRCKLLLKF